jgi:hypothetical protein
MADIGFVDVLSGLHGWLGEPVQVLVCSGQGRPRGSAAMLTGPLGGGPDARSVFGEGGPQDGVVFIVGGPEQVTGYLVLDPASFERAFWTDSGALTVAQGGIVFIVRPVAGADAA